MQDSVVVEVPSSDEEPQFWDQSDEEPQFDGSDFEFDEPPHFPWEQWQSDLLQTKLKHAKLELSVVQRIKAHRRARPSK